MANSKEMLPSAAAKVPSRNAQVKAGEVHAAAELASSLVGAEELEVQHFGYLLLQHMVRAPCINQCHADGSQEDLFPQVVAVSMCPYSARFPH